MKHYQKRIVRRGRRARVQKREMDRFVDRVVRDFGPVGHFTFDALPPSASAVCIRQSADTVLRAVLGRVDDVTNNDDGTYTHTFHFPYVEE